MKKLFRFISAILVIVLCMTSISLAAAADTNYNINNNSSNTASASSAYLIRSGGNYQIWHGVPSAFSNLAWSDYALKTTSLDAISAAGLLNGLASAIRTKYSKWKILSLAFLVADLNSIATDAFLLNVVNSIPDETAYGRIYESHASSSSGTLQYSKLYVKFYSNSSYSSSSYIGSSDTICLYAWPTGSKAIQE